MRFLPLFLILGGIATAAPDCQFKYRFTNRAGEPTDGVSILAGATATATINNTEAGCVGWSLMMSSEGFSGISLTLQTAPRTYQGSIGASTPGSWSTFSGTDVLGALPVTATTSYAYIGYAYFPFLRVNLATATGTGSVEVTLLGWKSTTYLTSIGSGTGLLASNNTWLGSNTYNGNVDLTAASVSPSSTMVMKDLSQTYTAGMKQSFPPSATTAALRIVGGSIPSSMVGGDFFVTAAGLYGIFNGTNANLFPYVTGSGVTPASAPTVGNCPKWGAAFSLTDVACPTGAANYYTNTTGTGIGPTVFTPGVTDTLRIRDTTAVTGRTHAIVQSGAGDAAANGHIFQVYDNAGNEQFYIRDTSGARFDLTLANTSSFLVDNNNTFRVGGGNFLFAKSTNFSFQFTDGADWTGTVDLGLTRKNTGSLQINNGTADGVGSALQITGYAQASLPASPNGSITYCTDCNAVCSAGGGAGVFCKRVGGSWVVF